MKTTILRVLLAVAYALIACRSASAQEIHTANIVMETRERVLRIESIIPATPKEVWKAFATEEGLKKWMAPVVALDLRIGGTVSTHYDKNASIGSPGTIRSGIVNYFEGELITYKVNPTSSFAELVECAKHSKFGSDAIAKGTRRRAMAAKEFIGLFTPTASTHRAWSGSIL